MKKHVTRILTSGFLALSLLTGCVGSPSTNGSNTSQNSSDSTNVINISKLNIAFVPSKDPDQIITATEPLKEMLKNELSNQGYSVGEVNISVGTNYEAVGEALVSGTVDVGFIPGGTYVLYDDGADVLLTATRDAINHKSENPVDWNQSPTEYIPEQATSYRSILVAGPSAKGKELSEKINSGQELTWEDLNSAKWGVMSPSSSAGYIYPTLFLNDKYGKSISDLENKVQSDSYGSSVARLAAEQVDVITVFADARIDYAEKWTNEYGRAGQIWDETNVIGVAAPIYNDTISVSKNSPIMTPEFKNAFATAMINIANTEEGKKVVSFYSHKGYERAQSADYDNERRVQKIIRELQSQ